MFVYLRVCTVLFEIMAQPRGRGGRSRKYPGGWGSANSRIYLSKEVFCRWRAARARQNLTSDNDFAKYLLSLHNNSVVDEADNSVCHLPSLSPPACIP